MGRIDRLRSGAQGGRVAADRGSMRRAITLGSAVLLALAAAGAARPAQPVQPSSGAVAGITTSWASPQIATVTAAGLLGADPAAFRPDDPVTRGEIAETLAVWGKAAAAPADPSTPVTMSELDAQLVAALGLGAAAKRIRIAAKDGQLAPTSRLGTETVARLLGLRLN